jgi:hypothetical protein
MKEHINGILPRKTTAKRLFSGMAGSPLARVNLPAPEPATAAPVPEVQRNRVDTGVSAHTAQRFTCAAEGCTEVYIVSVGTVMSPDFRFLCKQHTPLKSAKATDLPRAAITPKVRKQINQSLATPPNVIRDSREAILVEGDTSEGVKTVRATDNAETALEDAAEKIVRKSSARKSGDALLTAPTPKRQTAYLKSVAHPAIPTNNPNAPYGLDDNDRPIGVPVGKPYVVTGVAEVPTGPHTCNEPTCRHCQPETSIKLNNDGTVAPAPTKPQKPRSGKSRTF